MIDKKNKRQAQNRRDMILVGVLVFICILLYVLSIFITPEIRKLSIGGFGENSENEGKTTKANTATPRPTITPTQAPSATPKPTNKPASENDQTSSEKGIGVSRSTIQTQYETQGFTFKENGSESNTGEIADQSAAISLIGPAENLTRAMIIVYLPPENRQILARNITYTNTMIKTILPSWKEGSAWLYTSIGQMASMATGSQTVEKDYKNIHLRLKMVKQSNLLTLICEEKQP